MYKIVVILLSIAYLHAPGQSLSNRQKSQNLYEGLKIGDKVPNVVLKKIINYSGGATAEIADFKGRVIVLDFWETNCKSCIRALPELDKLQKKFKSDLIILPVTHERVEVVQRLLGRLPSLKNLNLPCVISDTILHRMFPHITVPHEVVIDKEGIIQAITDAKYITEENVQKFIKGEKLNLPVNYLPKNIDKFSTDLPLFMEDLGQKIIYHSVLSGRMDGLPSSAGLKGRDKGQGDNRVYGINMLLLNLYRIALHEKLAAPPNAFADNRVILNVKDRSIFFKPTGLSNEEIENWRSQNTFCFDLVVPANKSKYLFKYMKEELDKYFDIDTKIEKRRTKCLLLKTLDSSKYKSAPIAFLFDKGKQVWSLANIPIVSFTAHLNMESPLPILNETGFSGTIAIQLPAEFDDLVKLKNNLRQWGFDLLEDERDLDMIIISQKRRFSQN